MIKRQYFHLEIIYAALVIQQTRNNDKSQFVSQRTVHIYNVNGNNEQLLTYYVNISPTYTL